MKSKEDNEAKHQKNPSNFSPKQDSSNHFINTYTVFSILMKMKHSLGLEAMLEYLEHYLRTIEKDNPRLKMAVQFALSELNIEKIYKEALSWKEKEKL